MPCQDNKPPRSPSPQAQLILVRNNMIEMCFIDSKMNEVWWEAFFIAEAGYVSKIRQTLKNRKFKIRYLAKFDVQSHVCYSMLMTKYLLFILDSYEKTVIHSKQRYKGEEKVACAEQSSN